MPNMQGFVHRKNGGLDKPSLQNANQNELQAFKMAPPPLRHPLKAVQGNQPRNLDRSPQIRSLRSPTGELPFYGTDASGIDRSTAPGSVIEQVTPIKQEINFQNTQFQNEDEDGSTGGSSESDSDEGFDDEDGVDESVETDDLSRQQGPFTTHMITGDSFPSTTSGPPSILSTHTQTHANAAQQRQPFGQSGNPMRNNAERAYVSNSGTQPHGQPIASANITSQYSAKFQKRYEVDFRKQATQGFQSGKLTPYSSHRRHQSNQSFDAGNQVRFKEHSISDRQDYGQTFNHSNEDEEMKFETLDHDPPQLFDMKLHDLQNEKFDYDPKADEFIFTPNNNPDDLHGKLEDVFALAEDEQMRFFASLDIHEWEEAGDWFLDKFSGLIGKFKKARQEKRKAALAFEREIEARHEAIAKQWKLTEQALDGMKANGHQMLAGTPKSKKEKQ